MGVVNEAIQARVSEGWVPDDVGPEGHRDLTGDDGGAAAVAVFKDLEQVDALVLGEDRKPPIVENEQVCPRDVFEKTCVTAVATGECEGFE